MKCNIAHECRENVFLAEALKTVPSLSLSDIPKNPTFVPIEVIIVQILLQLKVLTCFASELEYLIELMRLHSLILGWGYKWREDFAA